MSLENLGLKCVYLKQCYIKALNPVIRLAVVDSRYCALLIAKPK